MPAFSLPALLRALAVWALIILAETIQGALRRVLSGPEVEFVVRQASVVLGAAVIFGITWLCLRWMRIAGAATALAVGVFWAALTLAFEIGLGRALGFSWGRIFEDYDPSHGGLMPLGLVAMALTPWMVWRLQRDRAQPKEDQWTLF